MSRLQDQLSTGKRVLIPSDDPEAANRILRAKDMLGKNEQFQKNVGDATATMQSTAAALDSFSDLLLEAKDIITRARSGIGNVSLETFAEQLDQIIKSGVQTANTSFNGKYLFGGTQTRDVPFTLAPDGSAVTVNPNGITGAIQIPVGEGAIQTVNIDGQQAFLGAQIFQDLIVVRDAMRGGTIPSPAQLDGVTSYLSHVAQVGGKAGLILNSLDMSERFLTGHAHQLAVLLSNDEDTDFAESTLLLKKEELMLEAALNIGARLIPKTLMDFLR